MKKNFIITLVLGLILSCGPVCTHVHTDECGKDGENCTHICNEVDPQGIDHEKPGQ